MTANYAEGDWFAVPLTSGGFAVGLVARANPRAALLGYFFGPRRRMVPSLGELSRLTVRHAVLVGKFGHLGLKGGTWANLGRTDGWERAEWPMPVFSRYEELTGRWWKVYYDADDPAVVIREEQAGAHEASSLPRDGLMGAGYVEEAMSAMLDSLPEQRVTFQGAD